MILDTVEDEVYGVLSVVDSSWKYCVLSAEDTQLIEIVSYQQQTADEVMCYISSRQWMKYSSVLSICTLCYQQQIEDEIVCYQQQILDKVVRYQQTIVDGSSALSYQMWMKQCAISMQQAKIVDREVRAYGWPCLSQFEWIHTTGLNPFE